VTTAACSAGRKRSWIIYYWLVWCEKKNIILTYNPENGPAGADISNLHLPALLAE